MAGRQTMDDSLFFSFGNQAPRGDDSLPDQFELPGDEVHHNGSSPTFGSRQTASRKGTGHRITRARGPGTLGAMNVRVQDNDPSDQNYSKRSLSPPSEHDEGMSVTPRRRRLSAPSSKRGRIQPTATPHHNSSAQRLKASLKGSGKVKGIRRRQVQDDPENYLIMKLRVDQKMNFTDIAKILNEERIKTGGQPTLTQAACYGRFVRNAPLVAAKYGDDLDPKEWMNIARSREGGRSDSAVPVAKFSSKQDEQLVRSYEEVQANLWNAVAEKLAEKSGVAFTPEDCAKRFKAI